jgi:hypothetical protein
MEILRLLDQANWIIDYEVQDYKQWQNGFYYRLKIQFEDNSVLFVREYADENERNYAFHWQDENYQIITRWDNAPHHRHIVTFPHHKHTPEGIVESLEISLPEVIEEIQQQLVIPQSFEEE